MNTKFITVLICLTILSSNVFSQNGKWKRAKKINTIEQYESFIERHPDSKYKYLAFEFIDSINYLQTDLKDLSELRAFISKAVSEKYIGKTRTVIDQLEMELWEKVKTLNTNQGYQKYLEEFPKGKYTDNANQNIEELDWVTSVKDNTIKTFERYIEIHPNGIYSKKCNTIIDSLYWHRKVYNTKKNLNYISYIRKFPEGKYVKDAYNYLKTPIYRARIKIEGFNKSFDRNVQLTDEDIVTYIERLEYGSYSTSIISPVPYYRVSGIRCNEATVKTKRLFYPKEIEKVCSLHLELGKLSISAYYCSNPSIKHPLFVKKRSAKMTHNGCSGPGLEINPSSELFLKFFSIEYHSIAGGSDYVIPDLIWNADKEAGYGHNGEIFDIGNSTVKIEGYKCDISKLPKPITSYKQALEIKTYINSIISQENKRKPFIIDENGVTELMKASSYGQVDLVSSLINKGIDVNKKDLGGKTALIYAIDSKNYKIASILLDNGADVNSRGSSGATALIKASQNGHYEMVKILLENGANVNLKNDYDRNALICAAQKGNYKIIELLLQSGANVNSKMGDKSSLIWATEKNHEQAVEVLLTYNSNVNTSLNNGTTALDIAKNNHNQRIIQLLVNAGAKEGYIIGTQDKPVIIVASELGKTKTIELLIEKGEDVNIKGRHGQTALVEAIENGHQTIAKILIQNGADVNLFGTYAWTPLWTSIDGGHTDIVRLLLENGANPNKKNGTFGTNWGYIESNTPLIAAVKKRNLLAVQLLIEYGADVNKKNSRGENALNYAIDYNYKDIEEFLIKVGAKK